MNTNTLVAPRRFERVHEAHAFERLVSPGDFPVFVLDVLRGDVIGEEHHLVGEELSPVDARQFAWPTRRMMLTMKFPVPVHGSRTLTSSDESVAAEVLLEDVLHAAAHEVHDLLRGVDDAVGVGELHRVALEEPLVDRFKKRCFSVKSSFCWAASSMAM